MYIWVILATFLAMLASYSLSVRPDMREVSVVPMAEAALGKIVSMHRAAKNYVKHHKRPFCGQDESGENIKICYDGWNTSSNIDISYALDGYKTYGVVLDDAYTSKIYCMTPSLDTITTSCDCEAEGCRRMVVTFGKIPSRWLNLDAETPRPTGDFTNAMRNMVNAGEQFGYMALASEEEIEDTENNPSGSEVRLMDRKGSGGMFIPKAVLDDHDFDEMCGDMDCIVYMNKA